MKFFFPTCLFFAFSLHAQSFQVGGAADEALRSLQLQGKISVDYSFTARPYTNTRELNIDSINEKLGAEEKPWLENTRYINKKQVEFALLPVSWVQQYNSHHPFGWNDGAMIPARGYQTKLGAGFFSRLGPLSFQFNPEMVYAANLNFETNSLYGAPTAGAYRKFFPGQSSLRLNLKSVSVGLSSENLWWGPGTYSSLLMSNNAPGFYHVTFNSIRPVNTFLGTFEWQLVAGKLEQDTTLLSQVFNMKPTDVVYPRTTDWRYLSGVTISWQPKWMKGWFLGINRVFQVYNQDLLLPPNSFFNDYLPVFSTLFKKTITATEDAKDRDQEVSLFTRFLFPHAHAEFYAEYGWNDHSYNIRDFVMSPTHSAAWLVGFKKQITLNNEEQLLIESEATHMQESEDRLVRGAGNWYEHGVIRTGYTNFNQIMGAGSGFGNNVQTLSVSQIRSWQKLGVRLDRIQNFPLMSAVKWTDYSLGLIAQLPYQHFLVKAQTNFVLSQNYAWEENKNLFHFHGVLQLQYRF